MSMIRKHASTAMVRLAAIALLITPLMGFMFIESEFAPKAELWPRWQAFNPASREAIDHRLWDRFLKAFVKQDDTGINRVAYGRIGDGGKEVLSEYLDKLSKTPIRLYGRNEQMAFWINLYNALTVQRIANSYPVDSIRDIASPFDTKVTEVEGEPLSLNDIEHRILRPIWRDPLIHYAVNCAAIGCPNLLPVAFTGSRIGQLLELAAHGYINHRRGARIEDGSLIGHELEDEDLFCRPQADVNVAGNDIGILVGLKNDLLDGVLATDAKCGCHHPVSSLWSREAQTSNPGVSSTSLSRCKKRAQEAPSTAR